MTSLAVGVLAVGGCSASPDCPPRASCPAAAPRVAFIPAVNGVSFAPRKDGHVPRYRVRAGERLTVRVAVGVPEQAEITALWFGISSGTWGVGTSGPTGMNPVLAHYALPLSTGSHTFALHWRIPHSRAGTSWYLTYAWSSQQPDASVSGPIAALALPGRVNRQLIWGGGLAS